MAKQTINCDIVSAEEEIFSGEAAMLYATGEMGELGIAPRHTPLLTRLKPGQVRIETPDGDQRIYYVSGGMLEVQPHLITILADTADRAENLDEAAAQRAKEDAERQLADRTGDQEIAEAQAQLAEAVAKIQTLQKLRRKLGK